MTKSLHRLAIILLFPLIVNAKSNLDYLDHRVFTLHAVPIYGVEVMPVEKLWFSNRYFSRPDGQVSAFTNIHLSLGPNLGFIGLSNLK